MSNQDAHPHKLPTVPGALGDKPEPKPKAIAWAGCLNMNAAEARIGADGAETSEEGDGQFIVMRNGQKKKVKF